MNFRRVFHALTRTLRRRADWYKTRFATYFTGSNRPLPSAFLFQACPCFATQLAVLTG